MVGEASKPHAGDDADRRLSLPVLSVPVLSLPASASSSWSSPAASQAARRRRTWATVDTSGAFRTGWTSVPRLAQPLSSSFVSEVSDDGESQCSLSSRVTFRSARSNRGSLVQSKIDQFLQAARRGSGADNGEESKLRKVGQRAKEAWERLEVKARDAVISVSAEGARPAPKAKTLESFYTLGTSPAEDDDEPMPKGPRPRLRSSSEPPAASEPPAVSRAAPSAAPDLGASFASTRRARPEVRTTVQVLQWPPQEPREERARVANRPAILHVCGRWSDDEDDSGDNDRSFDESSSGSWVDTSDENSDEAPAPPVKKSLPPEETAVSAAKERRVATPIALETFGLADRDGDGQLSFDDLQGLLSLLRWEAPESPDSVCIRAWKDLAPMGRNFASSHWLRMVFGPLPARSSAVSPLEPAPGPLSAAELRLMASALRCRQSPRAAAGA